MREVKTASRFRKELKKFKNRDAVISELKYIADLLANGQPIPESYRDHALTGNWAGSRELHLFPNILLVYSYLEDGTLLLERIGNHGNLFGCLETD